MNNIKHIFIPPYHPKSNGFAENGVRNFKNGLNKILKENKTDLKTAMARYLLLIARHSTPHENQSGRDDVWAQTIRITLDNVKQLTVTTSSSIIQTKRHQVNLLQAKLR
jgi:hypothetical protein